VADVVTDFLSSDTGFSFIIRDAAQWGKQPDALPQDIGLVAYVVCPISSTYSLSSHPRL